MPFYGSYNVSRAEEGNSPVPKESPKASKGWIFKLIGFFVACGVIVAVCLLVWRLRGSSEKKTGALEDSIHTAGFHGIGDNRSRTSREPYTVRETTESAATTKSIGMIEITEQETTLVEGQSTRPSLPSISVDLRTESPTTLVRQTYEKPNTGLPAPVPTVTSTTQPTTTPVEKNSVITSTESPPLTTTTDKITETKTILQLGKIISGNKTTEPSTTLSSTVGTIPPDPSSRDERSTEKITASSTSSPDQETISKTTGTLADGFITQKTTEVSTSSTELKSNSETTTTLAKGSDTDETAEPSTSAVDQEPSSETTTTLDDDSTSEGSTESSTPSSDTVQNTKLEPNDEISTLPDTEGTTELEIGTNVTTESITSGEGKTTESTTNPGEQITTIKTTEITETPTEVTTTSRDRELKSTNDTMEGSTTGESNEPSTSTVDQEPSSETTTTLDDDSTSVGSTVSSTLSSNTVQNTKLEPADENSTLTDTEGTTELGIYTNVTTESITSDAGKTTELTTTPEEQIPTIKTTEITETPTEVPTSSPDLGLKSTSETTEDSTTDDTTEPSTSTVDQEPSSETTTTLDDDSITEGSTESSSLSSDTVQNAEPTSTPAEETSADENTTLPDPETTTEPMTTLTEGSVVDATTELSTSNEGETIELTTTPENQTSTEETTVITKAPTEVPISSPQLKSTSATTEGFTTDEPTESSTSTLDQERSSEPMTTLDDNSTTEGSTESSTLSSDTVRITEQTSTPTGETSADENSTLLDPETTTEPMTTLTGGSVVDATTDSTTSDEGETTESTMTPENQTSTEETTVITETPTEVPISSPQLESTSETTEGSTTDEPTESSTSTLDQERSSEPMTTLTEGSVVDVTTESSTSNEGETIELTTTPENQTSTEETSVITVTPTKVPISSPQLKSTGETTEGFTTDEPTESSTSTLDQERSSEPMTTLGDDSTTEGGTESSNLSSDTVRITEPKSTLAEETSTDENSTFFDLETTTEPMTTLTGGSVVDATTDSTTSDEGETTESTMTPENQTSTEETTVITETPTEVPISSPHLESTSETTEGSTTDEPTESSTSTRDQERSSETMTNLGDDSTTEGSTESSSLSSDMVRITEPTSTATGETSADENTTLPDLKTTTEQGIDTVETTESRTSDKEVTTEPTTTSNNRMSTEKTTGEKTMPNTKDPNTERNIGQNNKPKKLGGEVDLPLGNQSASRMLLYMNHSANACDDFYEYACGRFEADHRVPGNDLGEQATRRIFDQADKTRSSNESARFLRYYESCVNYENDFNKSDRVNLAQAAVLKIGKFYTEEEFGLVENFDFTSMLSELLLHNSAPLFDIVPEIAAELETHGNCREWNEKPKFILKLGPPVLKNSLYVKESKRCYNDEKSAMRKDEVDLKKHYENYKSCKTKELLESVEIAIEAFPAFKTHVDSIRSGVEFILDELLEIDQGRVRQDHITKSSYSVVKIEEISEFLDFRFLDWTRLIKKLRGTNVSLEQSAIIHNLEDFSRTFEFLPDMNQPSLNNALLGLYAHKIYHELVVPGRDEKYCKRIAMSLMKRHASSLYMSSFTPNELDRMKDMVTRTFDQLKTTLIAGVKKAKSIGRTDDTSLIMRKIHNLSIAVPDTSHKQDLEVEAGLTGNFFLDTIRLQHDNRKSMYLVLDETPSEATWTYLASPHQTSGSVVHGINEIIMPYGAVDWRVVWDADRISSWHLVLATLGTSIAHEIAHHFDTTGLRHFQNMVHDFVLLACRGNSDGRDPHENNIELLKLFAKHMVNLSLPSTGQKIRYEISDLSLDERISDSIGLKLAYDTMLRLSSNPSNVLPWLAGEETNEKKQFFLAYAQTHCTKEPLTSSFVSLYEDEHLPSRLRISAVAGVNKFLETTWDCPKDSIVSPEQMPRVFPDLKDVGSDQNPHASFS